MSEFLRDFDDILDAILTDYRNLDSAPDTSVTSMPYIKAACMASMLWGLYRYQDYIARQIFADTADTENLNHWGSIYNVTRQPDDTDQQYLDRILQRLRLPPAGGNRYDWADWTKYDVDGNPIYATGIAGTTGLYVEAATVIPNAQGPGTVDVVLMPNDITYLNTTGMEDLRALAEDSVEEQRPVTATDYRVITTTRRTGSITIAVTAPDALTVLDTASMVSDIQALFDSLVPGQAVYRSQLAAICINNGAINANVISPTIDLTVDNYTLLYASSITVTQA